MKAAAFARVATLILSALAAAAAAAPASADANDRSAAGPRRTAGGPVALLAQAAARPRVRDVTAPGMTPGPEVDGPLQREAVPEPPPLPPRWRRSFGAVAIDAGTLDIGPRHARLPGILVPAADQQCTPDTGPAWPCGRAALTALRLLLRGRAIECYLAPDTLDDPVEAPCRVGATELVPWLVAQGWAEPAETADEDLRRAARDARCAGRGVWRDRAPPADCP